MPAYECSGRAFAAQHGGQNIAIKHPGNWDAFRGRYDARDSLYRRSESFAMMRPRATEQSAIDIEKDQGFGLLWRHLLQYKGARLMGTSICVFE